MIMPMSIFWGISVDCSPLHSTERELTFTQDLGDFADSLAELA